MNHFISLLGSGTGKGDVKHLLDSTRQYWWDRITRTHNSQGDTRQLPNSQDKSGRSYRQGGKPGNHEGINAGKK